MVSHLVMERMTVPHLFIRKKDIRHSDLATLSIHLTLIFCYETAAALVPYPFWICRFAIPLCSGRKDCRVLHRVGECVPLTGSNPAKAYGKIV